MNTILSVPQRNPEEFEEYYGYDKIASWLSNVIELPLDELQKKISTLSGNVQNTYLRSVLEEADYDINNITEENYNAIHDVLNNKFIVMEKELSDRVLNIRSAFQNMLYTDSGYWNIDDENVLSAINSLYGSIDAEFIKNNELFSQKALQTFESDFVSLFSNDVTNFHIILKEDFYKHYWDNPKGKPYESMIEKSIETPKTNVQENKTQH